MLFQRPIVTLALIGTALVGVAALTTSGAVASGAVSPGAVSSGAGAAQPSAANPVVIELFHSQGCSSCPPAEADLNAIANRPDVLALSFSVTYWDRLGWKDTFGSEAFTARQIDYARAGKGEVATPEFIVNGGASVVGADRRTLEATIARVGAPSGGPAISPTPASVRIEAAPANGAPATVWLVRYDPRTLAVPVHAGENGGRVLAQRNVVRELVDLGRWTGSATSFALPRAHEAGLASAVLVQRGTGGPIVSVRKL